MEKPIDQDFRDRPNNIDASGQRKWIRAKQPKGKWYLRRNIVGYTLLTFLIIAPFLKISGHPFMLLDILTGNSSFSVRWYLPKTPTSLPWLWLWWLSRLSFYRCIRQGLVRMGMSADTVS